MTLVPGGVGKHSTRIKGRSGHGTSVSLRFKCEHPGCEKMFNRRDYLERHAANHLEVKPFVCHICDRSFSRKDLYDNHLATKVHTRRVIEVEQGLTESAQAIPEPDYDNSLVPDWNCVISKNSSDAIPQNGGNNDVTVDTSSYGLKSMWSVTGPRHKSGQLSAASVSPAEISQTGSKSDDHSTLSDPSDLSRRPESLNSHSPNVLEHGARHPSLNRVIEELEKTRHEAIQINPDFLHRLREPTGKDESVNKEFDSGFEWFFDDNFPTEKAKYGYDTWGISAYNEYARRARAASLGREPSKMPSINHEKAIKVLEIFENVPSEFWKNPSATVNNLIYRSWTTARLVPGMIHRPTYDPNNCHMALLAVLVLLGLALSPEQRFNDLARSEYASVLLFTYKSLVKQEKNVSQASRYDLKCTGYLQAFCLILRYEPLILDADTPQLRLSDIFPRHQIVTHLFWALLNHVPHLNEIYTWVGRSDCQPIWGTIAKEAYIFHESADQKAQWREWAAYEMNKRALFYTVYHDNLMFANSSRSTPPLNILTLDVRLPCPRPLWEALTDEDFFLIVGQSRSLINLPYLGVLKALVRFSRLSGIQPVVHKRQFASVSLMEILSLGLVKISTWFSRRINRARELKASGSSPSSYLDDFSSTLPLYYGEASTGRIYRGFDIWFQILVCREDVFIDKLFKVNPTIVPEEFCGEDFMGTVDQSERIPTYALISLLLRHALFIDMHEDTKVVAQVASNLKKWLSCLQAEQRQDQAELLSYLYMPLYEEWMDTEEARAILKSSVIYIALVRLAISQMGIKRTCNAFCLHILYVSTISVWLVDLTSGAETRPNSKLHLSIDDLVNDALAFLQYTYLRISGSNENPVISSSVNSVILFAACILNVHAAGKPLADILTGLLLIIDKDHSLQEIQNVLRTFEDKVRGQGEIE